MGKGITLQKDIEIDVLNELNLESFTNISTHVKNEQSLSFDNLSEKVEINITESGTYNFEHLNTSKYIDINIAQDIKVDLYLQNTNEHSLVEDMQVTVNKNSELHLLCLDKIIDGQIKRYASVKENAILKFNVCGFADGENNCVITIDLEEEGADATLRVISIAKEQTLNTYETTMNNLAPNTSALIWQKAVVLDGGRNEFLAIGHISKGSDLAKNFQESRVLLLDNAASGDASPLLLIDHYNVEAGHAASVSRVNEDDLYYLQSRGISKRNAENLITIAFVRPLIDEIGDEQIKQHILDTVKQSLNIT